MNNNKVIMMKKLFEMTVAVVIALMVVLITTTSLFVASGYIISVLFRFSLLDSTMLCIGAGLMFAFSILVIGLIVAKKRSFDIFESINNDEDYFDIYTPKRTTTSRKKKI